MKIFIILLFSYSSMSACEICGCSISNSGLGILPNYQNHFVGLRYKYSPFSTIHPDDQSTSTEYFNNLELWGRFVPYNNLQIFAFVPFVMNRQFETGYTNQVHDFGDASLLFNYMMINKNIDSQGTWKQLLQAGGGVKLPTGKHSIVENQHTLLPNLQPGTGSIDYIINVLYVLRYKNLGLNLDANYRLNTENDVEYKIGNKFSISSRLFYVNNLNKNIVFLPHLGIDFELSSPDRSYQQEVKYTGNKTLLGNLGADLFYKNISLGFNLQLPISQEINSGYTTNPYRVSTQLIYFFNSNKNNKICQI